MVAHLPKIAEAVLFLAAAFNFWRWYSTSMGEPNQDSGWPAGRHLLLGSVMFLGGMAVHLFL